jgi:hypothetical protein
MMAGVARALMAVAVHCLGDRRREWGQAMEAEFEAAADDRRPLTFALGCLGAAARQLPSHTEGRLAIASHLVALVVIVPAAALLLASVLAGFPTSFFEVVAGQAPPAVTEANQSAIPSLAVLVATLAALNLRLAWLALDRDWEGLRSVAAMSVAVTVTLLIFTAVVFADYVAAIAHAGVLAAELLAIVALARWHGGLHSAMPREIRAR